MKLPEGEKAMIPEGKLRNYCLNESHPRGRNKARVFRRALGVTADNPQLLERLIRQSAVEGDAVVLRQDAYGIYYRVELEVEGLHQRERLRTLWIIRHDEEVPRLISAFIV
ncbi:MAG: hypothetical protein ETSY1_20380 [Candidatus Entotheonella factor]|uniref:DUF6883 domain-containing protein n=1 Tax=Entotheonella factor TaxID=1429438 RepID=W4LL14_ENTF1|nr:MAG: hypothetical protein ETSY1_20380 [Candidatus Entotheonella factor]